MSKGKNSDSIKLTDLNKSKKSSKLPKVKVKNPFKKQKGPARDVEGKFTAGSGGLLSAKKFNTKRALPIVLVVALVGGIFVFRSFAATKPPAYQYSIFTCTNQSLSSLDAAKLSTETAKCVDESAEAYAYRVQLATAGNVTDARYQRWTQRLAGDRVTYNEAATAFVYAPDVRWGNMSNQAYVERVAGLAKPAQKAAWVKEMQSGKLSRDALAKNVATLFNIDKEKLLESTYQYNNQQFVQLIFRKLLKRGENYTLPASSTYLNALETGQRTRGEIVSLLSRSTEAKQKNRAAVLKYVASKPKVAISQTAKTKQKSRESKIKSLNRRAKQYYELGAKKRADAMKKLVSGAKRQADANPPTAAHVQAAKNAEKEANIHLKTAQKAYTDSKKTLSEAKKILDASKKLSQYAKDISNTPIVDEYKKISFYTAASKTKVNEAQSNKNRVVAYRSTTEKKYSNEQARIAAAKKQSSSSSASSVPSGLNPSKCTVAHKSIRQSSGKDCIAKLQQLAGITVDGIWGPKTQAASSFINTTSSSGATTGPCATPTSSACKTALAKSFQSSGSTPNPLYKDAVKYYCGNSNPLQFENKGMARHGMYYSCIYRRRGSGNVTHHSANTLTLTCPSGYQSSLKYTSQNKAGTQGLPWTGKLCKRV